MLLKVPSRRKLVISLTPLIDVVFILLVFFMLASSFDVWREYEVTTQPPVSADPLLRDDNAGQSEAATLKILDDGRWTIDDEIISSRQILRQRLAATPDLVVVVQPAGNVPMQSTMNALDTVREAGVKTVSLKPFANREVIQ